MKKSIKSRVDIDDISTWMKYKKKLCSSCSSTCCNLPVEVKTKDLVRMGLIDEFELQENPKTIARRLIKAQLVEHFHSKSETFTISRMASGDCLYLDQSSRLCTIYTKRPDTCRNHPHVGPRPGFCPYQKRSAPRG